MILTEIAQLRLHHQQIAATKFTSAKEIVSWMGAIQAQDYAMSKWALGVRLPGATEKLIETEIDKGKIIRTHVLRPTWHLVSSDDIYWMLELTAPRIKAFMKSQGKQLELTENIYAKCNAIFRKELSGGKHLTREELLLKLEKAKIATDNYRSSHLLMRAELDQVICSGARKNKKQTYTLLEERVPKIKRFTKEESLAKLAKQYFTSHCPATLADFSWWSGLTVADCKTAIELIKPEFTSEKVGEQMYLFTNKFSKIKSDNNSIHVLPAFDEYLISYKDRSASLDGTNLKNAITANGIFRPLIVINGKVTGLWNRTTTKEKVIIGIDYFHTHNKNLKNLIEKKFEKFGTFLEMKTEVNHTPSK